MSEPFRILRVAPLKDPGHVEKMEKAGLAIKPLVGKEYAKYYMDLHERCKQLVEAARKAR